MRQDPRETPTQDEKTSLPFLDTLAAQLPAYAHEKPLETIRQTKASGLGIEMPSTLPRIETQTTASDIEAISLLGEGGMGQVLLARQRSLDREVALKSVKPSTLSESTKISLLREALYMGGLEHPNIVPVHALGLDDKKNPVIVMKRIEGVSWRSLLQKKENLARHIEILMQVCNAVHFAHSRGIIHRDIKPDNVMVGSFGEVYLVDWGVALRLSERERYPSTVGTPAYMAPEMLSGGAATSPRTDVYLLGATLHEILAGEPPHLGDSIQKILWSSVTSAPREYSDAPQALAQICQRAMHREPEMRFESVDEMRQSLSVFLRYQGATKLIAEAKDRLQEASQTRDLQHLRKLYAECRFGFQQAIIDWPENQEPRDKLQECLRLWIECELSERNYGAAALLFEELSAPAPELAERLQSLEMQLKEEASAKEKLRRLEHESDPDISRRQRAIFSFIIVLINALFALYTFIENAQDREVMNMSSMFVVRTSFNAFLCAVIFSWRSVFFGNQVNQKMALAVVYLSIGMFLYRLLAFIQNIPMQQAVVNEGFIFGVSCWLLGAFLSLREIIWGSWVSLLFCTAAAFFPIFALGLTGLGLCAPFAAMAWLWRKKS